MPVPGEAPVVSLINDAKKLTQGVKVEDDNCGESDLKNGWSLTTTDKEEYWFYSKFIDSKKFLKSYMKISGLTMDEVMECFCKITPQTPKYDDVYKKVDLVVDYYKNGELINENIIIDYVVDTTTELPAFAKMFVNMPENMSWRVVVEKDPNCPDTYYFCSVSWDKEKNDRNYKNKVRKYGKMDLSADGKNVYVVSAQKVSKWVPDFVLGRVLLKTMKDTLPKKMKAYKEWKTKQIENKNKEAASRDSGVSIDDVTVN